MTRAGRFFHSSTFSLLLALALPVGVVAQPHRVGSEFQVNTVTAAPQMRPSAAAAEDGDFVVVWQSYHDGSNTGVFGQRFSSAGVAQAGEFLVNTRITSFQFRGDVSADTDGDFVVVWISRSQDGDDDGVFGQRFSSTGDPVGAEFQVNSFTQDYQFMPSVAIDADGDFVVAWEDRVQDGAGSGIFAQRFSSDGAAQASEFQVNEYTIQDQQNPWVAAEGDGDFVIVWQSRMQDGNAAGVFARRFSSSGASQASEFQVNAYTTDYQTYPSVALTTGGAFVVAWQSYRQVSASSAFDIFARPFSSAGNPMASEFQVNLHITAYQRYPSVAAEPDGDFVVAWQSETQDGGGVGIFGRAFSSAGSPVGSEFQVNTYTQTNQYFPALGGTSDGDFVVAWVSYLQDGGNQGVFAQRFSHGFTLDIDGDGTTQALTDGILVLRFLFGFTGGTLVASAVDPDCARCDAPAIEDYLEQIAPLLNVDGNPSNPMNPLTNGLLVLRYLFGFTGDVLIAGAVSPTCTRCDAPMIETYLALHTD